MFEGDMSVNSSDPLPVAYTGICATSYTTRLTYLGFFALKTALVVPLCAFVFFLGIQRWRLLRSSSKSVTQSGILNFQLVAMEMLWGPGFVLYMCGLYLNNAGMGLVGSCSLSMSFYGEMFFHMLTCVDWYLAVVHPIIYVRLRSARGVRLRNICFASVWLLCLGLSCSQIDTTGQKTTFCIISCLSVCIAVVTFCSLSVLCALIRPGPGEKERVDQLKQRAFCTITAISSMLWLWFLALFIGGILAQSHLLSPGIHCLMFASVCWFNLPSSLISPLLFLHRAGKLSFICSKKE